MARLQCDFFSETLGLSTSMDVLLPQSTAGRIGMTGRVANGAGRGHPTLWLLHGLSDDHTVWGRRTSIERYAAALGLAVVMPNVHRSFYADMAQGLAYWSFVAEELPVISRAMFPLSEARSDNFVVGLSMGGYGAFKHALTYPERYAAAASLSGALDVSGFTAEPSRADNPEFARIFGPLDQLPGSSHDLIALADRLAQSDTLCPSLYQCCGDADFLLDQNHKFRERAQALGLPLTYREDPGDAHEWGYWDRRIQDVLDWLPIEGHD